MLTQKDMIELLIAIKGVPKECVDCVAFHQEGHISTPCRGDFDLSCRNKNSSEQEPPKEET